MKIRIFYFFLVLAVSGTLTAKAQSSGKDAGLVIPLPGTQGPAAPLKLEGFFYVTAAGTTRLPEQMTAKVQTAKSSQSQAKMPDGRVITISLEPDGKNYIVRISAQPSEGVLRWGLAIASTKNEHFTGIMERVVDGPQEETWASGRTEALDLHGQKVDMILKPTLSVYAPFYVSSRGYAAFVHGTWPGFFDFAAADPERVKIEFEGPSFEIKIYTAEDPAALVRAH